MTGKLSSSCDAAPWYHCREAAHLIGNLLSIPAGVKPLSTVLADYILLTEREVGRRALAAEHPALAELIEIIDNHTVPAVANVAASTGAHQAPYQTSRPSNRANITSRSQPQDLPPPNESQLPPAGGTHVQWVPQNSGAGLVDDGRGVADVTAPTLGVASKRLSRRKRGNPAAEAFSPQKRVHDRSPAHMLDMPLNEAGLVSLLSDPDFQV